MSMVPNHISKGVMNNIMETAAVEKLRRSYQDKADRAYQCFQETGSQPYHWRSNRYQDIADLAGQVLSFNDERNQWLNQRSLAILILAERNKTPEQKIKSLRSLFNMREE